MAKQRSASTAKLAAPSSPTYPEPLGITGGTSPKAACVWFRTLNDEIAGVDPRPLLWRRKGEPPRCWWGAPGKPSYADCLFQAAGPRWVLCEIHGGNRELSPQDAAAWFIANGHKQPRALEGAVIRDASLVAIPGRLNEPAAPQGVLPPADGSKAVKTEGERDARVERVRELLHNTSRAIELFNFVWAKHGNRATLMDVVNNVYELKNPTKTQQATARKLIYRVRDKLETERSPLLLDWDDQTGIVSILPRET